jgi:hypothetical protein
VANYGASTVSILPGHGYGTFTAPVSFPTGNDPISIAVADLNGDSKTDVVVANEASDTLTVLLGKGDGTFTAAASPATGIGPFSVAAGDFNGDGKPDLAVANQGNGVNTVSILLGAGDGSFTAAATVPTGAGPSTVLVGDFNADGSPDLATSDVGDNTVTLLLGNGDGTFVPLPTIVASLEPYSMAVGDFNGDGRTDLAAAGYGNDYVAVLLTRVTETATATFNVTTIPPPGSGNRSFGVTYPGNATYLYSQSNIINLIDPAMIGLSQTSMAFAEQAVTTVSSLQDIAVSNTGGSQLTIRSAAVTGQNPTSYATSNNCSTPLAPSTNQRCYIRLRFAPKAMGALPATLTISSNDAGNSPQVVQLTGTGINSTTVTVVPSSVNFGTLPAGTSSPAVNITLTNTGSAPLVISGIGLSTSYNLFATSNNCPATLAPAGSCTIRVRLTPETTGLLTGSLYIDDNTVNSPQIVPLSGTGTTQ